MTMTRILFLGLAFCSMASQASATAIALDATGGLRFVRGTFANFGWAFSTSEDRVLTALGLWSYTNPGLSEDHAVGIWDGGGNLIADAVLSDTDDAFASAASDGVWRFQPVAPVRLPAGDFVIGAYFATDADHFRASPSDDSSDVNLVLADWLAFGGPRISNGADGNFFQQPTRTLETFDPSFFGPSFLSNPVPEPATWSLVLLALAPMVRRSRNARGRASR